MHGRKQLTGKLLTYFCTWNHYGRYCAAVLLQEHGLTKLCWRVYVCLHTGRQLSGLLSLRERAN